MLLGNIPFSHLDGLGNHVATVSRTDRTPSLGGNHLVDPEFSCDFIFELFRHDAFAFCQTKDLLNVWLAPLLF